MDTTDEFGRRPEGLFDPDEMRTLTFQIRNPPAGYEVVTDYV